MPTVAPSPRTSTWGGPADCGLIRDTVTRLPWVTSTSSAPAAAVRDTRSWFELLAAWIGGSDHAATLFPLVRSYATTFW